MIHIEEVKAQIKGMAICTECLMLDDCLDKYPKVGCPAFRFHKRIAMEGFNVPEAPAS